MIFMKRVRFYLVLGLVGLIPVVISGCLGGRSGPTALFTAAPDKQVIPFTANFDGTLSYDETGKIVSYTWDFGDGATDHGPVTAHVYKQDGVYKVKLTVIDNHGRSSESSITVQALNPPPKAVFSYSPKSKMQDKYIVGASEWITFDASKSTDDGEIVSYDWNFGDGTTAKGKIVKHRYIWPGTYNVVLTVTDNDGGKTSYIQQVHILGGPPCNADISNGDAMAGWSQGQTSGSGK